MKCYSILEFTNRCLTTCVGFLLLTSSLPGHAYSVDNHEALTRQAIKVFNRCAETNDHLQPLSPHLEDVIVEANRSEDEQAPVDRFKVWHFYDPTNRLRKDGVVDLVENHVESTSLHEHFNRIEADILAQRTIPGIGDVYLYRNMGKLLHYIQDVTVPAHAVPIFHPLNWLHGWFFTLKDAFDEYPVELPVDNIDCAALSGEQPVSFNIILNKAADNTLESLTGSVGKPEQTWSCFWSREKRPSGFGQYGQAGNKFGKANEITCNGASVSIQDTEYQAFAASRHFEAITSTARAISHLQSLLKRNKDDGAGKE